MCENAQDQARFGLNFSVQTGVNGSAKTRQMFKAALYVVFIFILKFGCIQGCSSPYLLTGTDGIFTSPAHPQTYPNNTKCTWIIHVPQGYTITLTFHVFNVESHVACAYDAVLVYDGASRSDPLLGKYCGLETPPIQLSSGVSMLVEFITDQSDQYTGFNSSYHAVKQVSNCSGDQTDEANRNIILRRNSGSLVTAFTNITSIHCIWRLKPKHTGAFTRLKVNFTSLDILKTKSSCLEHSLSIYTGHIRQSSSLVARYCNISQVNQSTTVYQTKYLWIELKAANVTGWSNSAFAAHYEVVERQQTCSTANSDDENNSIQVFANLTARRFTFTDTQESPNNQLACQWKLMVPNGYKVKLEFVDFQFNGKCGEAHVEVLDGVTKRGKFCGPWKPWVVYSTGEFLYLKLVKLKNSDSLRSFTASFQAVRNAPDRCSKINTKAMNRNIRLSGTSGVFFSPNYPDLYHDEVECIWIITVPQPWRVKLEFREFDIEDLECSYDYVQIRDGGNASSNVKGNEKYCGKTPPTDIYSSANQLWVKFITDETTNMKGFLASYSVFLPEPGKCSILNNFKENNNLQVNGWSGFITSPRFPNKYPSSIQCSWAIKVPKQHQVALRFQTLQLPVWCKQAYLEILDGGRSSSVERLGPYCGYDHPIVIHSTNRSMTIVFRSQAAPTGDTRGFNLTYSAVKIDPDEVCKLSTLSVSNDYLSLTRNHGYFTSPNDYSSHYSRDMSCTWRARAPPGYHVELSFDVINLPGSTCSDDYVEVRDGSSIVSPLKTRRCGTTPGPLVYSSGRDLLVRFDSRKKAGDSYKGFIARYRMIRAGNCSKSFAESWNQNLNLQGNYSGVVTSPAYPGLYPPDIRCSWKISVPRGYKMTLAFALFSLGSNCSSDFVVVKDGLYSFSREIGRFCGTNSEIVLSSSGLHLMLHFESGKGSTLGKGFHARYQAYIVGVKPSTEPEPVHGIVIILGSFGGIVVATLTGILLYWLITKRRLDRLMLRRAPRPSVDHALTPLPSYNIPTLDDIPDALIAEDRPPTYFEATADIDEEIVQITTADVSNSGHTLETGADPSEEDARGLDNLAFVASTLDLRGDPPSYEELYASTS